MITEQAQRGGEAPAPQPATPEAQPGEAPAPAGRPAAAEAPLPTLLLDAASQPAAEAAGLTQQLVGEYCARRLRLSAEERLGQVSWVLSCGVQSRQVTTQQCSMHAGSLCIDGGSVFAGTPAGCTPAAEQPDPLIGADSHRPSCCTGRCPAGHAGALDGGGRRGADPDGDGRLSIVGRCAMRRVLPFP